MLTVQRIFVMLTAAAMIFVFLLPLALRRGDIGLVAILVAIFVLYVGVNAWLYIRVRRHG